MIGAQKAGTTSLWEYLRDHPRLWLAAGKEAPFFTRPDATTPSAYRELIDTYFGAAPSDAQLGKVTPHYMMGSPTVAVERIAARITAALPEVRLIALLRDPVERAVSHYRMSVRRELERRSFEQAAWELLAPEALARARAHPDETNSYLVQGEYGRILSAYCAVVPSERLCVLLASELERDPAATVDRVLSFLGLEPGYRPPGLGVRHHRGGVRPRIDAEARMQLLTFLDQHVWPACTARERDAFNFFFETWNVVPDDDLPSISTDLRAALDSHYERDAARLRELGIAVPWAAAQRS